LKLWRGRKGCAGGGVEPSMACALMRAFMEALEWGRPEGLSPLGSTRDELESLILAQNERWRHA
jgi:hypothetical protein